MAKPTTSKSSSSSWALRPRCSPVAIFGFGLIIAQLIIFNIGVSVFQNNSEIAIASSSASTAAGYVNIAQQQSRPSNVIMKNHKVLKDPKSDGTFNGYPIYYHESIKDKFSLSHCIGENYQEGESWKHRSCRFTFLCFDMSIKDYVVFQHPDELKMASFLNTRPFVDVSQSYLSQSSINSTNAVSIGGINLKWTNNPQTGIPRLKWFPKIVPANLTTGMSYYELPSNVVLLPFHSLNGGNPGHLIWDDFLPIYTLLSMFQLLERDSALLMMRYVLQDDVGRGLWATCDWKDEKRKDCEHMYNKFIPLMMGYQQESAGGSSDTDTDPKLTTTNEDFQFILRDGNDKKKSNLICARNGVAGIGALTDHGATKAHGWEDVRI